MSSVNVQHPVFKCFIYKTGTDEHLVFNSTIPNFPQEMETYNTQKKETTNSLNFYVNHLL